MSVTLSILPPSVPGRISYLQRIIDELDKQSQSKPVEILMMLENKKRTIGEKQNIFIEQAQRNYVVFVDDDDRVESNYIDTLCSTIDTCLKLIAFFDISVNSNNEFEKTCKYGKEYEHKEEANFYYRKPNHLTCYAKKIVVQHKFLNISFGEDDE